MAKSEERLKARAMRREGKSIKEIARALRISKSSSSAWCADIPLTKEQIEVLESRRSTGGWKGRQKGAMAQRQRKLDTIALFEEEGKKKTQSLNARELNMVGLGLYLGEGNKRGARFQFTNSDPGLVYVVIQWLKKIFGVTDTDLEMRILINEIHYSRDTVVKETWSKITNIPLAQFKKTTFIHTKNKKVYENADRYLGVAALCVRRSSRLQYRILGLMKGLVYNIGYRPPA